MATRTVTKRDGSEVEDRCPCKEKKICHPDINSAECQVEQYTQRVPIHTLESYPCKEYHGCWHTGHGQTKEARRAHYLLMNWWRFI